MINNTINPKSKTRKEWVDLLWKIAKPVLENGATQSLKANMPKAISKDSDTGQACVTHLEACARTLAGIAPWLNLSGLSGEEGSLQAHARFLAKKMLASIVDPDSPDFIDFSSDRQCLVEAGFLAQAILRAPEILWTDSSSTTKKIF
jgi:hypothetical protein